MLYVTTRDNKDPVTAYRALTETRSAGGGLYLPFRSPSFSAEALDVLLRKPFNACVCEILNLLFRTKLTQWELDFALGDCPVRLKTIGQWLLVAEVWHNPEQDYRWLEERLFSLLCGEEKCRLGSWPRTAIGTAVLFGLLGELNRAGIGLPVDISTVSGDFSAPMSALYAKQWGAPIGSIVCSCNENKGLWDLLCHGQLRTNTVSIPTSVPEADVALPPELERLIYECGGVSEVQRYLDACRQGKTYCVDEEMRMKLRRGLTVSVVSTQRVTETIPGVCRTHSYLLSPGGALAYGGAMDHRCKNGGAGHCLILTQTGPACHRDMICAALGMGEAARDNDILN